MFDLAWAIIAIILVAATGLSWYWIYLYTKNKNIGDYE